MFDCTIQGVDVVLMGDLPPLITDKGDLIKFAGTLLQQGHPLISLLLGLTE